jgi:L-glyceraldehyde 3-phosphate reductase
MAISWILRGKRITSVLVGVSTVEQLNNNLDSLKNLNFDPGEIKTIDEILK